MVDANWCRFVVVVLARFFGVCVVVSLVHCVNGAGAGAVVRAWFRWWCAEMENGDGGARNKLPWWPKVGRWWNCGGGATEGEVREWWAAATMVMVGEEENYGYGFMYEIEEFMTWQNLTGQFGEWRIMTRGLFWLANFKRWGLPHGMIWLSGV